MWFYIPLGFSLWFVFFRLALLMLLHEAETKPDCSPGHYMTTLDNRQALFN